MKISAPYENIMRSPNNTRVLRYLLKHPNGMWSGLEIARRAGVNGVAGHRALHCLMREGLVSRRLLGRTAAYSLVQEHILIPSLKTLFAMDRKINEKIKTDVRGFLRKKDFLSHTKSVVIFGSVAQGRERPDSDIDILFVMDSPASRDGLLDALAAFQASVKRRFGNPLSPIVHLLSEIRAMKSSGSPFLKNVLRMGQTVHGEPLAQLL